MASLSPSDSAKRKQLLDQVGDALLLVGMNYKTVRNGEKLASWLGLIDWRLHGLVSDMLRRKELAPGSLCLFAGKNKAGSRSILVYPYEGKPSARAVMDCLGKMRRGSLTVIPETFPQDFWQVLEETFRKEGIQWSELQQ